MTAGPAIPAGLVFVDGLGIGDVEQVVLRDRRLLAQDGILVVTLAVDRDTGMVRAGPDVISRGFIEPELSQDLMREAASAAADRIRVMAGKHPDLSLLQETVHDTVSRVIYKRTKRRPMVIPLVQEL
jgi:ribonuclease J